MSLVDDLAKAAPAEAMAALERDGMFENIGASGATELSAQRFQELIASSSPLLVVVGIIVVAGDTERQGFQYNAGGGADVGVGLSV